MPLEFVASLTDSPGNIRQLIRRWDESGDRRNPFASVLITPLFASQSTLEIVRCLKEDRGSKVYFDSGGFWVQRGKVSYRELYGQLLNFYTKNKWADWYILPDNVPTSADTPELVEKKAQETVIFSEMFFREMPDELKPKALPVVQGHTQDQLYNAIEAYSSLQVKRIGFGSFGTSGKNNGANHLTLGAKERLRSVFGELGKLGIKGHVFGVGIPTALEVLADLEVASFDSVGWFITAGYGKIFLPFTNGRLCTIRPRSYSYNCVIRDSEFQRLKLETGHSCKFCSRFEDLQNDRWARILHNLACVLDTVQAIQNKPIRRNDGEPGVSL